MKLTKNFKLKEFECKGNLEGCYCRMPDDVYRNIKELAENLQIVRDELQEPITINSAYRCEAWNGINGGTLKSQHLQGKAADIVVKNLTPDEVATALDKLQQGGFIAFLTLTLFIYIILDSSLQGFKIDPNWIDLLSSLLLLVYGGYFGMRSAEKITKNWKK